MKHNSKYFLIIPILIFFSITGYTIHPVIENRVWVLEKFRDPQTGKEISVNEYHFLNFGKGIVSFNEDCNTCSDSCRFISKDSIYFYGEPICTRKGCLKDDLIKIYYSGTYKIWKEDHYLIIRTPEGDHIYR